MKLVDTGITRAELGSMAEDRFGDLVKAVVDVHKEIMVVDADLHSDEEACLLENGSAQADLWGINVYPGDSPDEWIEFDSLIDIRPSQGNRSRGVDDPCVNTSYTGLTDSRWRAFSLVEQLANVGSEVERAMKWSQAGRSDRCEAALFRGLELLDLTLGDPGHRGRLKELTRLREVLLDYFLGPNEFGSSDLAWHQYFHAFGVAAAVERERTPAS
jgi:hypothetical protein